MKRVIMTVMMIVLMIASMAVPVYAIQESSIKTGYFLKVETLDPSGDIYFAILQSDHQFQARYFAGNQYHNLYFYDGSNNRVNLKTYIKNPGQTEYTQVSDRNSAGFFSNQIPLFTGNVSILHSESLEEAQFSPTYDPEYNYNINPGEYVRFTKPGSQSWGLLVNVVSGNEPYMQIRNYNASGYVNTYFASPLSSISVLTNDHIDIDLKSTRNNEPLVITTKAQIQKLSTGGTPPPDGTVNQELRLTTNPDTAIFTNLTGKTQYISYWREEIGENQFTQIKVENKVGNYWQVMGATPQIKDVKVRKIPIAANVRYTIYNNNGSTKITYPVTEGFNVQTLTQGVYNEPGQGGGIAVPDDPSIITDPSIIYPNLGNPSDTANTISQAIDNITGAIQSLTSKIGPMATIFNSFLAIPAAIMSIILIGFGLRLVLGLAKLLLGR